MTFVIPNPESKKHLQENKNDLSGTIFKSRQIDLDDSGYVCLSTPSVAVMTTTDSSDLDTVDAMYPCKDAIFFNSDEMFSGIIDLNTLTNRSTDTGVPTPSVEEDVIFFNDAEVVSDGASIFYRSASTTWTSVSTSLSATAPTVMAAWDSEDSLAVGGANLVKFVNSSWAVNSTVLTLPADYQVSSLETVGNTLFIGTRSLSGGDAKLFTISTIQVGVDFAYESGSFEIMSVKQFKSSVVLITSQGQLLRFNGGGFDQLAQLPVYSKDLEWADANNDYTTVSNRSMVVDGDLIYINLSSLTKDGKFRSLPDFPSGVWCYDDTNDSFYHRYSPSATTIQKAEGGDVTVSVANDTFTLTSGNLNAVVTGMPVVFNDGSTLIPELVDGGVYYIIKDSSTVFKLATTYTNALAGTQIDITGVGHVGQDFFIILTSDYGWTSFTKRMSMAVLNSKLFDSTRAGRIAIAADLFTKQDTGTDLTVINGINPNLPNRGYFVTPRLNSPRVVDEYNNIWLKYSPLTVDDQIIIKYKDIQKYGYPFSSIKYGVNADWDGNWTSTTVFTTEADLSSVVAGEEVEIIAGVGSGHIAFISTITENAGTYTVTLDEAFPYAVSGDKLRYNVDNWKKVGQTITSSSPNTSEGVYKVPVSKKSKFLQIKIEMRGVKVRIEELIINNKDHKSVV